MYLRREGTLPGLRGRVQAGFTTVRGRSIVAWKPEARERGSGKTVRPTKHTSSLRTMVV